MLDACLLLREQDWVFELLSSSTVPPGLFMYTPASANTIVDTSEQWMVYMDISSLENDAHVLHVLLKVQKADWNGQAYTMQWTQYTLPPQSSPQESAGDKY